MIPLQSVRSFLQTEPLHLLDEVQRVTPPETAEAVEPLAVVVERQARPGILATFVRTWAARLHLVSAGALQLEAVGSNDIVDVSGPRYVA